MPAAIYLNWSYEVLCPLRHGRGVVNPFEGVGQQGAGLPKFQGGNDPTNAHARAKVDDARLRLCSSERDELDLVAAQTESRSA